MQTGRTHTHTSNIMTMGMETHTDVGVYARVLLARHRKRSTGVTATFPDSYQLHTDDPRSIFRGSLIIAQLKI